MDSGKDKAKLGGGLPARQTNTSMNTRLEIDAKLDKILESNISTKHLLDTLLQRVNSLDEHVETLTGKTHDNEVGIEAQKTRVTELEKKLDQAMEYINQLENRNRQNNLRLLNVPEGQEEDNKMIPFLIDIFQQKWSLDLKEEDFERAHRVGIRKETAKHPRAIIFKLHHFQKKLEILKGSKKKSDGCVFRVVPDMSAQLRTRRAAFWALREQLHQQKIKTFFRGPATLCVDDGETVVNFGTLEEAKKELKRQYPTIKVESLSTDE